MLTLEIGIEELEQLPDTVGLDMENGEFVDTKEETNATD